jgi:hypothetical protein
VNPEVWVVIELSVQHACCLVRVGGGGAGGTHTHIYMYMTTYASGSREDCLAQQYLNRLGQTKHSIRSDPHRAAGKHRKQDGVKG